MHLNCKHFANLFQYDFKEYTIEQFHIHKYLYLTKGSQ